MTNQVNQAFEKWIKENYPDYPPPLSEVWKAATKASESEINSLKERVAELQASNNKLRGLCEKIYADLQRGNACRDTMDNLRLALSSTPTQSLAEHDNEVIERIALALENAEGEFKTLPEYVALVRVMKND